MNVLKAISSFILSLFVLLSSMGFYVDHMVCGMSGEHKLAINQTIDRCSDSCERSDDNAVKQTCCDYDSFYFKEDVPATSTERTVKPIISAFRFVPLGDLFPALGISKTRSLRFVDDPVFIPSVKRHVLLQTFLI